MGLGGGGPRNPHAWAYLAPGLVLSLKVTELLLEVLLHALQPSGRSGQPLRSLARNGSTATTSETR